jgi:ring-1,2-phenylacetyl-CoA epoxidase subunit PaaC
VEYRNCQMLELPKGDFAFTIVRQFLFDAYAVVTLDALSRSSSKDIADIATKALKEAKYHIRHSGEWVIKLGDGTDDSHRRAQRAVDELWRFTVELFASDGIDRALMKEGVSIDLDSARSRWDSIVGDVFGRATLTTPADPPRPSSAKAGRAGVHTEFLGHMLAEMQIVARSHPGATW